MQQTVRMVIYWQKTLFEGVRRVVGMMCINDGGEAWRFPYELARMRDVTVVVFQEFGLTVTGKDEKRLCACGQS